VVQESLRVGALGYVDKKRAEIDLLAAVEAVCEGRRFVSSGLSADNCTVTYSSGKQLLSRPRISILFRCASSGELELPKGRD
jgi:DNA-binding NarL/FixJ family response regulator